jgi:hypothetical protein
MFIKSTLLIALMVSMPILIIFLYTIGCFFHSLIEDRLWVLTALYVIMVIGAVLFIWNELIGD